MKAFRGLPHILLIVGASMCVLANRSFAQTISFVSTGSMTTDRYAHSATLLNNGKVLLAGGWGGSPVGALTSAELYDPATGTFTATGSMTTAHYSHTATLLNNGKVLIAGGLNTNGPVAVSSAELYDPATETFTATGSMTMARAWHTATLLNNGKVLVAGGASNGQILSSAELYDPSTGTFTATGDMTTARDNHTATLLNNGTILVAGGENIASGALSGADLYDPSTGTFTATGSMTTARYLHTATLLNNGWVLVTGGENIASAVLNTAELYDPNGGTFRTTGPMAMGRYTHTANLLNNGTVLIAGGTLGSGAEASAELFDPSTRYFTGTGSMNTARQLHTATVLNNGKVLVAGGNGASSNGLVSAELYDVPAVSLFPATINFGNQTTGIASAPQSVTLTNNQSTPLNLSSITFTGADSGDFAESDTCGSSLTGSSSCTINVTFTPAATGARGASLSVTDDAPGSPQTIPLTGTGITPAPAVSLTPSTLTFAAQPLNSTSGSQTVTLTNTGYAVLTVTSISITGTNSGDFAQADSCGSSVAAGASCTIGVNFTPSAVGARAASLSITDDASDSPQTVPLAGTGALVNISLAPNAVDFGEEAIATTSAARTVTVTNSGTLNVTLSAGTPVMIVGASGTDFSIASGTTCVGNLVLNAGGGSCVVDLTFTPVDTGSRVASVQLAYDAGGSPLAVALSGTGSPQFTLQPDSMSTTVTAGQTAQYVLQLTPGPGFAGMITMSCTGAPAGATCDVPGSLVLGVESTTPFSVTVSTKANSGTAPLGLPNPNPAIPLGVVAILGIVFLSASRHRKPQYGLVLALLVFISMALGGCAAGPGALTSTGTPVGTYTLVVKVSSTGTTQSIPLTLTVQ